MSLPAPDAGTAAATPSPDPGSGTQSAQPSGIDHPRTPILPRASSLGLNYKDMNFGHKVVDEMLPVMIEISFANFMSSFLSTGSDLTDADFAAVGDFSELCDLFSQRSDPSEQKMYPIIAKVVNQVLKQKTKKFIYKDTANWYESAEIDIKPDGCIFPVDNRAKSAWKLTKEDKEKSQADCSRFPFAARTSWGWAEVVWEIKPSPASSAFFNYKIGRRFLHTNSSRVEQLSKYAAELFRRQHRTHLFMVCITRTHARIIRWDRAAAVVSESIDLKKSPRRFFNFISRLVTTTPDARGHDLTVRLAGKAEIRVLEEFKCEQDRLSKTYASEMVKDMLDNALCHPIYRVTCPSVDNPKRLLHFFIGKECWSTHSPTGRATKGFIAYYKAERRLVFLKDYWRPDSSRIHPELETYKLLQQHSVSYVAYPIAGGDVGGPRAQSTQNEAYLTKGPQSSPLKRIHYRVVSSRVGRPLDSYTSSAEMIAVVFHALRAHRDAWEKAGILHRDISVNNILIDIDSPANKPLGFLNDWDLCKYKADLAKTATQNGRSGTWPFLSALLLQYPKKPTELADDLESFVHVITWLAFRFHEHKTTIPICLNPDCDVATVRAANGSNDALSAQKNEFFDASFEQDGYHLGPRAKYQQIKEGKPPCRLVDKTGPLSRLLDRLYSLLRLHYEAIDPAELDMYDIYSTTSAPSRQYRSHGVIDFDLSEYSVMSKAPVAPGYTQHLVAGSSQLSVPGSSRPSVPASSQPSTPGSSQSLASGLRQSSGRPRSVRPLDNHAAIIAVFLEIVSGGVILYEDKTADQFLGLAQHHFTPPKGPWGASKGRYGSSVPPQGERDAVGSRSQRSTPDINTDIDGGTPNAPQFPSETLSSGSNGFNSPAASNSVDAAHSGPVVGVRVGYRDRISSQLHTNSEHEVAEYPGSTLNVALDTPGAGSSTLPTPDSGAVADLYCGAEEGPSQLLPDPPKRRRRKRKGNTDGNRGGRKRRHTRR
ncbi:hypothetical protein NM688_g481 [Phlebia brevispora]|uniref:Uncharacterized protein n=1 Tax=Phlebia brevispora TaxID=194682 RepID=A0ACC1TE64_9APHY|nr:hypothetical protein NM688_g481 [Phlebia brevispora]